MQDSVAKLPEGISQHEKVYATTLVVAHTCQTNMPQVPPSEGEGSSAPPSSAAAMQQSYAASGVRGRQFVYMLRGRYKHDKRTWNVKRVHDEMRLIEPSATYSKAKWVIKELRGMCSLPMQESLLQLQGLASHLVRQGFGVMFFQCDAACVRAQIYAQSKNQFASLERAAVKAGRVVPATPFKPADISKLTDKYKDVESGEFFNIYTVSSQPHIIPSIPHLPHQYHADQKCLMSCTGWVADDTTKHDVGLGPVHAGDSPRLLSQEREGTRCYDAESHQER